jgi:hypothetical protein
LFAVAQPGVDLLANLVRQPCDFAVACFFHRSDYSDWVGLGRIDRDGRKGKRGAETTQVRL